MKEKPNLYVVAGTSVASGSVETTTGRASRSNTVTHSLDLRRTLSFTVLAAIASLLTLGGSVLAVLS